METAVSSAPFDAIVIGTGFGGAVTACRLVEAGFRICVLERGRRYGPGDFPSYPTEDLFTLAGRKDGFSPPPDFSRWLWSRDHGIYDVRDLDDAVSIQAAGYGGGSLIYANVHLRPPRELFDDSWPPEYRPEDGVWRLDEYFDLAAYMLRAAPVPKQLAKTIQLQDAVTPSGMPANHWFRTPLAVNFEQTEENAFGRPHQPCEMCARCWLGCNRQAKNTLDRNYLARAEDGERAPVIQTLANVTLIERKAAGLFTVTYDDLLVRGEQEDPEHRRTRSVDAKYVFLCAGALNTTELLLRNWQFLDRKKRPNADGTPLGSHYFPNADSLAAVFDCKNPHEADYGPTITAGLVYTRPAEGDFSCSLDFIDGRTVEGHNSEPAVEVKVTGEGSGATGTLSHTPLLDWGHWQREGAPAAGALILSDVEGQFEPDETLSIGGVATARARSRLVRHRHWLLVEDGGYPPDIEPLVGVFRSPLWMRRNRYVESLEAKPVVPTRRPPAQHLRLQSVSDSLLATARSGGSTAGLFERGFATGEFSATRFLSAETKTFFPDWFVKAIEHDRKELLDQAGALALPLLGRLLGDLSNQIAEQADSDLLTRLLRIGVNDGKKKVLIRGMLRQGLQILAGSEAAIASNAAKLALDPVPGTPEELLGRLGDLLLWALAYSRTDRHTGIVLTMGRDLYRGRLLLAAGSDGDNRLTAQLPDRLLDTSHAIQERVLRAIASTGWHGELRTNPAWAALGQRITVHNQGGCPMGPPRLGVTDAWGEVYDCSGLYVMDAAAFPTSVGVNPSATIAAVAELKIEHFIREREKEGWELPEKVERGWKARDQARAKAWVDQQGRAEIDPLNKRGMDHSAVPQNQQAMQEDNGQRPPIATLGLTFEETMRGFVHEVIDVPLDVEKPEKLLKQMHKFTKAEDAGIGENSTIEMHLTATAADLARLISPEHTVAPMKLRLTGNVSIKKSEQAALDEKESFLQLFVRPSHRTRAPMRFFRYKLLFVERGRRHQLDGFKVLHDSPGFDLWRDTSTVYCEIRPVDDDAGNTEKRPMRRGVMRISIEDFLQDHRDDDGQLWSGQLRSMNITGTGDSARKSWALAAFYRYFAVELATVYAKRADALKGALMRVLTNIHV